MDAQYTAVTGGGYAGSEKYAVAYTYGCETTVSAADGSEHEVSGCFVTNNLWTYQSVTDGDFMTTPFGGESGNDPDFLYVYAVGRNADNIVTDTAIFYLADFRFDDNTSDYVINSWEWFDLSGLGSVASISFGLESSKYNEWGMLTPSYFCLDNFFANDTTFTKELAETNIELYPNPARDYMVVMSSDNIESYTIFNLSGEKVIQGIPNSSTINVTDLQSGLYFILFESKEGRKTSKFVKQ